MKTRPATPAEQVAFVKRRIRDLDAQGTKYAAIVRLGGDGAKSANACLWHIRGQMKGLRDLLDYAKQGELE